MEPTGASRVVAVQARRRRADVGGSFARVLGSAGTPSRRGGLRVEPIRRRRVRRVLRPGVRSVRHGEEATPARRPADARGQRTARACLTAGAPAVAAPRPRARAPARATSAPGAVQGVPHAAQEVRGGERRGVHRAADGI